MARARNIKPAFFQNEDLADLSFQDRLFFIGLWTIADFKGCVALRPRRIKVAVMPYDECDVEQVLERLNTSGFVRIYSVAGQRYLKILNFEKHQRPHKNEIEAGSELPDEPSDGVQVQVNKEDMEKPEIIGTKPEIIGTTRSDSLLPLPSLLNAENGATSPPLHPALLTPVHEHPAVQVYQEKFGVNVSNAFAKEIVENVHDLGLWTRLISEKIAFAAGDMQERQRIAKWFLKAYFERVEQKQNERKQDSKLQSAADKLAADEADRANRIRPPVQRVSES